MPQFVRGRPLQTSVGRCSRGDTHSLEPSHRLPGGVSSRAEDAGILVAALGLRVVALRLVGVA